MIGTRQSFVLPEHVRHEVDRPRVGIISDLSHQVWILQNQSLVAVPRSGNVDQVTIIFITCKYPETLEQGKGNPIYLGIRDPEMCLCCEDVGGQHTLQLKKQKIMDLYNQDEPVKPFLFYHLKTGRTSTFESVAFPGWFIASSGRDQPLFLTSKQGNSHNIDFDLDITD